MININQESHTGNGEQKKKSRGRPFKKGNKFGCISRKGKEKELGEDYSIRQYALEKTKKGKELIDSLYKDFKKSNSITDRNKARDALIGITFGKAGVAQMDDDGKEVDIEKDKALIKEFLSKINGNK